MDTGAEDGERRKKKKGGVRTLNAILISFRCQKSLWRWRGKEKRKISAAPLWHWLRVGVLPVAKAHRQTKDEPVREKRGVFAIHYRIAFPTEHQHRGEKEGERREEGEKKGSKLSR